MNLIIILKKYIDIFAGNRYSFESVSDNDFQ